MASRADAKIILDFIKKLAEFEKLSHEVTATLDDLNSTLFSKNSNTEIHPEIRIGSDEFIREFHLTCFPAWRGKGKVDYSDPSVYRQYTDEEHHNICSYEETRPVSIKTIRNHLSKTGIEN